MPKRPTTEELWTRHRGWLAVVLLAHRPRGVDLDDLLQEVALTVTRTIGELRDPVAAPAWLRRIAVHVALGAGRRQAARPETGDDVDVACPRPSVPDSVGVRDEVRRALGLARALPIELREPLLLRSVHGLPQRDIAAALEISEEAVESRLARARRRLREQAHRDPSPRSGRQDMHRGTTRCEMKTRSSAG